MTCATEFALDHQQLAALYQAQKLDIPQVLWDELFLQHSAVQLAGELFAFFLPGRVLGGVEWGRVDVARFYLT